MLDCIINLGGKAWNVVWKSEVDNGENTGHCDYDRQRLLICDSLDDEERIETVIHECLHAQFPWMTEESVTASAKELTDALFATGTIRKESDED